MRGREITRRLRHKKKGPLPPSLPPSFLTVIDKGVQRLVDHRAPGQVRHGLELVVDVELEGGREGGREGGMAERMDV